MVGHPEVDAAPPAPLGGLALGDAFESEARFCTPRRDRPELAVGHADGGSSELQNSWLSLWLSAISCVSTSNPYTA